MSKRVHLICNAHLDPIWQWGWEEGAAEAISTFRIAARFCEEYDNFVFCHNEALLYRWIEEYDGELFQQIQNLVKLGKWHIMGGWYLQPDCNMPSGEAMVRQISEGRKYFREKFGVEPTVAVNVDSFGHSRGLVQIMKKFGYDGYLFMRPHAHLLELPGEEFSWIGYDGSEITAIRLGEGYNTLKGHAAEKIQKYFEQCPEGDSCICMWGIGNHGGGPSKVDLDNIKEKMEAAEDGEILHSTPEDYLNEKYGKGDRKLPKFEKSIHTVFPGCYTSQIRIKQNYRQAENEFFMTESMCSQAALEEKMEYPAEDLTKALYDILLAQFHDMLPGTVIKPGEEQGLRMLAHAREILSKLKMRAFTALSNGHKTAREDRIPIYAYNPYPYIIEGDFSCEFMLWDQNWDDPFLECDVYDENGELLASQSEKEDSNLPIQWRKRATFHSKLAPMSVSRFDCGFTRKAEMPVYTMPVDGIHYVYKKGDLCIRLNRETGLIDEYSVNGVDYVKPGAFELEVYEDNFDPWYMEVQYNNTWKNRSGVFALADKEEAQRFGHLDMEIEPVHIIENGKVRSVAEALFTYGSSRAVVKYMMSEKEGLKITVDLLWNEKQKLVKLNIPAAFAAEECIGEQLYGREALKKDMIENVSQKYTALCGEGKGILAMDNGIYGSSFDSEQSMLKLTLLRSPIYCTHPLPERNPVPQDRYVSYIDQGERSFEFQFKIGAKEELLHTAARTAQQFNMRPMLLSFYPKAGGNRPTAPVLIQENDCVQMTAFKQAEDGKGYIMRLFNPTESVQRAVVVMKDNKTEVMFGAFEIKTFIWKNGILKECSIDEKMI